MAFSTRTMQPNDWKAVQYFQPGEFREPQKMGLEFIHWLDEVRARAGVKMVISSSYRSPSYNRRVGGAKDSAHTDVPCNAVDIVAAPTPDDPNWNRHRFRIVRAAIESGCTRIGVYANGSLHLDRSEDVRPDEVMWPKV